jgi:hypothetical protein
MTEDNPIIIGAAAKALQRAEQYRATRAHGQCAEVVRIHRSALLAHADDDKQEPLTRSQSIVVWSTLILALIVFCLVLAMIADKAFHFGWFAA